MAKYTNEFKQFIVEERLLRKKTLQQIEIEQGVLRSTTHTWVKRYKEGTLFINKRTIADRKTNIIQDTREKRKKALFRGRICLLVMSLLLAPPLIIMDAMGVGNPTLGVVAACLITVFGILGFFSVSFFVKSVHLKEELVYLENIKTQQIAVE